jgi:hypothetical protein
MISRRRSTAFPAERKGSAYLIDGRDDLEHLLVGDDAVSVNVV